MCKRVTGSRVEPRLLLVTVCRVRCYEQNVLFYSNPSVVRLELDASAAQDNRKQFRGRNLAQIILAVQRPNALDARREPVRPGASGGLHLCHGALRLACCNLHDARQAAGFDISAEFVPSTPTYTHIVYIQAHVFVCCICCFCARSDTLGPGVWFCSRDTTQ